MTTDEVKALLAAHDPRGFCDECSSYVDPSNITDDGYHRDCPTWEVFRYKTLVRGSHCSATVAQVHALCAEVLWLRALTGGAQ